MYPAQLQHIVFLHCIKMQPDFGCESVLTVPRKRPECTILGHISQNFQGEILDPPIMDGNKNGI